MDDFSIKNLKSVHHFVNFDSERMILTFDLDLKEYPALIEELTGEGYYLKHGTALKVYINYHEKVRPSKIVVTYCDGESKEFGEEDLRELVDILLYLRSSIENIDVVIHPYVVTLHDGSEYVRPYLKELHVTLKEDK